MWNKNKKEDSTKKPSIVTKETLGFTFGAFSILVLLILFTGDLIFGALGIAVTSFLFGVFGFLAYAVFIAILYFSVTLVIGKNLIPGKLMTVSLFLTLALVGFLLHAILADAYRDGASYGEYLSACFEAGNNGVFACTPFGVFGGLLAYPIITLASASGAYILFVAGIGLCGYLFVNSILIYKGVRIKPRKKTKEGEKDAAQSSAKPIAFEDLENNRMPQTAEEYRYNNSPSAYSEQPVYPPQDPYSYRQQNGYGAQNEYNPKPTYAAQDVYPSRRPSGNIIYDKTDSASPYNNAYGYDDPLEKTDTQNPYDLSDPASVYDRSRKALYGPGINPSDYRNRNLIFDTNSNYNTRSHTPAPQASGGTEKEGDSYNTSSYSQMYSKELDGRNVAPTQTRKIVQDTPPAQGGYSMYKTDVFNVYNPSGSANEPIRPSYKAPDYKAPEPVRPVTPSVSSFKPIEPTPATPAAPVEPERPIISVEPVRPVPTSPAVEKAPTPLRSLDEPMSLKDRFTADRENRLNERKAEEERARRAPTPIPERETSVFDRQNLFDDDFNTDEDEEDVPDFRAEEKRNISLDRSREGLSSTLRETRLNPPSRGVDALTPPTREAKEVRETVDPREIREAPFVTPATRGQTGRAFTERETPLSVTPVPTPPPKPRIIKEYVRPSLDLFESYADTVSVDMGEIEANKRGIMETLAGFNIATEVVRVTSGPSFTRYDITIPKNVTAKTIARYADNIAMSLHATADVNIYSNFSQGTIAIEVPNRKRATVGMRNMLLSDAYINAKPGSLAFCVGKDVEGRSVCCSLTKMPHMLVAGATGSGKSVFLNELIISLIMKYSPEELRLILIDPKQIEFAPYDKLPHLMINEIIADVNKVIVTLNWAINEMEHRYTLFRQLTTAGTTVRNIDEYNAAMSEKTDKLPKIVIIVDELADLMSVAKKDIEDRISRIAAKARAAGIHLVLATQRPSVDVITGVLKSNLPSRFAFRVSAEVDSRVILDETGAENLLGAGDLLYKTGTMFGVERVQGAWLDSPEIQRVCDFIRQNNEAYYDENVSNFINSGGKTSAEGGESDEGDGEIEPVYIDALRFVVQSGSASISMIQRKCSVGYNKAGKIIEWMEISGYISPFDGAKSRKVLLSADDFQAKYGEL